MTTARRTTLLLTAALLALALVGSAAAQTAAWLDGPGRGWNRAGVAVPPAPSTSRTNVPRCATQERAPAGAEESAVAAADWRLATYWPSVRAGDLTVTLATAGYDGMCRPIGYQGFVFVGGRYAGTLAPDPMASRTDGAIVTSAGGPGVVLTGDRIEARFIRYAPTDPLCCSSRGHTRVSYRIERDPGGPIVVPESLIAEPAASPTAPTRPPAIQLPRTGGPPPAWLAPLGAVLALAGARLRSAGRSGSRPPTRRPSDAHGQSRKDVR